MHSLLLAVTAGTRIILVGDENQLPSVGPGNVLRDIIQSGVFPVVELKKIFRQASHSDIVVNAHKIHNGQQISLDNKSRDFFLFEEIRCGHYYPGGYRTDPGEASAICGCKAF